MPSEEFDHSTPKNMGSSCDGEILGDAQWATIVDRLTRYARQALWHVRKGTGDYDDAVLSTLRTYLRQQSAAQISSTNDPDDIWPLLKEQLKRKIDKVRHQQRYASNNFQRDGDLADPSDLSATSAGFLDVTLGPDDVERYIQEALDTTAELIDDQELLQIARLKLESYTTEEIANLLNLSEHKVRRRVSKIRALLRADGHGDGEVQEDE